MAQSRGPNRAKYQKEYNKRPEEMERRRALGRARYALEKEKGPIPEGMDIHHKKPVRKGGGYSKSNLAVVPPKAHRGWNKKRGKK